MTKEISTDAELMSRLLTTQPTPAECLVAAARIEQLAAALAAERAKVAKLVEAGNGLHSIVEGIQGAMEHGTWRDEKGNRLKDTPEWVAFYNARAAITEASQ